MGGRKKSLFSLWSLTLKLAVSVTLGAKRKDRRLFIQLVFCSRGSMLEQFTGQITSKRAEDSSSKTAFLEEIISSFQGMNGTSLGSNNFSQRNDKTDKQKMDKVTSWQYCNWSCGGHENVNSKTAVRRPQPLPGNKICSLLLPVFIAGFCGKVVPLVNQLSCRG